MNARSALSSSFNRPMLNKGEETMNVYRYEENPLLTRADVKPHREDFEVVGVFNAGIAKYQDEVI
jgi:hypothetical protein